MGIIDAYVESYYEYRGPNQEKYGAIMESDLSISRMWLALYGFTKGFKAAPGNKFYAMCFEHNSGKDKSVRIVEERKTFVCYGCYCGGTIVDLVSLSLGIDKEDVIDILYAYIQNDMNLLNTKEKEKAIPLIQRYNSSLVELAATMCLEKSAEKTEKLNSRILASAKHYGRSKEDLELIAKRVSCSERYVKKLIGVEEQVYDESEYVELPFDVSEGFVLKTQEEINTEIKERRKYKQSVKETSDGYHTFGDYVDMRTHLFIALCNAHRDKAWKSRKHFDEENDPMFDGDFIAGINAPSGVITFHLKMKYWDELDVQEIDRGPKYDGYTDEDVKMRIKSLYKQKGKN